MLSANHFVKDWMAVFLSLVLVVVSYDFLILVTRAFLPGFLSIDPISLFSFSMKFLMS
jgi:hypothetical protein